MNDNKRRDPPPAKYWVGDAPATCDLCGLPIEKTFVDGRIAAGGQWGNMDLRCHRVYGVGVGTGNGQVYVKQDDGRFMKTEG